MDDSVPYIKYRHYYQSMSTTQYYMWTLIQAYEIAIIYKHDLFFVKTNRFHLSIANFILFNIRKQEIVI